MTKMSRRNLVLAAGASLTAATVPGLVKAQEPGRKNVAKKGEKIKIKGGMAAREKDKERARMAIPVTVINSSSVATKSGGQVGLQDSSGSGDPYTATLVFDSIAPGATKTLSANLPTGVEVVIFAFYPASGAGDWSGIGFGVDAPSVEIELVD